MPTTVPAQYDGSAFPWILEHLLAYPGTYEIPLRTMYTLNATTQNPVQIPSGTSSSTVLGNAFPGPPSPPISDEQVKLATAAAAAAHLRSNLMTHISQLPSQPTSLPPSFIISFVRKCFPPELEKVDFPQALTAMDYLKDLEIRRRREVLAALDRLGVDRNDIGHQERLAKKYPCVMQWVTSVEDKERMVEAQYTQVYIGLRRWTLVNEMSLAPFNKANCLAMLNTLYPPMMPNIPFVPPTAQLTAQILSTQRQGFFKYITEVEKKGKGVLSSLIGQHKRPGDASGWPSLRDTLDNYLRMAGGILDQCFEITSPMTSPTAASFTLPEGDEETRRKVDSGISFGSSASSNRYSEQSHVTRPSTSSSYSTHNRKESREKQLLDKPLPTPAEEDETIKVKPASSTLERIARELRKIRSRGHMRDASRGRPETTVPEDFPEAPVILQPVPPKDRSLRLRKSLRKMRSNSALRETDGNSRPSSRTEGYGDRATTPNFDAEEMKQHRKAWEAQQQIRQEGR